MTFSLASATELLPKLRMMLDAANSELAQHANALANASSNFEDCESQLESGSMAGNVEGLREKRARFQTSIEELGRVKGEYVDCFGSWVERFAALGVILRDIESGLLDFPASQGNVDYFLCWRREENAIEHWHLEGDGYMGRRPLAVLQEYF